MKTTTLLRALLNLCPERDFEIAKELDVSACALSRTAAGLLKRRSVLQRCAAYFTKRLDVAIDADLLVNVPLSGKVLTATAAVLRTANLKGQLKQKATP